MIVKDLDTLGYHRVVFRCDNEPSVLSLLRAVKLAWTGDMVQETSAEGYPQSNGAAESSLTVVKGQQEDEEPQPKRHRPEGEGRQRELVWPKCSPRYECADGWLTNSGCVAQALSSLNHSSTVRQTIMSAMSQQLQSDLGVAGTSDPLQHRPPLPKLDILAVDQEPLEEWEAEDDVKGGPLHPREVQTAREKEIKGGPLDPREVKTARDKEIEHLWDMEVYEYSTEAESKARAGRNPCGLKWIDTNKGSAEAPRYRLRLVCTEVRHKGVEPIFSATPPLETLRILLGVACQEDVFQVEDPFLISTADVSRAHFYADAVRDVYVRLPDKDPKEKQPDVCGKFRKTMYGSFDAAQRW